LEGRRLVEECRLGWLRDRRGVVSTSQSRSTPGPSSGRGRWDQLHWRRKQPSHPDHVVGRGHQIARQILAVHTAMLRPLAESLAKVAGGSLLDGAGAFAGVPGDVGRHPARPFPNSHPRSRREPRRDELLGS